MNELHAGATIRHFLIIRCNGSHLVSRTIERCVKRAREEDARDPATFAPDFNHQGEPEHDE